MNDDQDVIQDIYSYFKETEIDDLDRVQEELFRITEMEIRLVRIKSSDMAN